jgi:hypothetical protein
MHILGMCRMTLLRCMLTGLRGCRCGGGRGLLSLLGLLGLLRLMCLLRLLSLLHGEKLLLLLLDVLRAMRHLLKVHL